MADEIHICVSETFNEHVSKTNAKGRAAVRTQHIRQLWIWLIPPNLNIFGNLVVLKVFIYFLFFIIFFYKPLHGSSSASSNQHQNQGVGRGAEVQFRSPFYTGQG
jgi:hypothetical protein